ncbi:putative dolichyl pyrophosphate Glc1Man9GlcNAc2 alpha-1,3-glucosyltransferase [Hypsibius exemplaris]|uniref:dolichyl-P-Glc:Glc1Man9GlcNAc2-PP-dolichol alpha-1,3-glucosyltransferase n=1 Tax=Hypsibius exemplaris TaxID=2072580 RepID=A0A1W0W8F2_HYPEX|nr:putative dolichyl pyrophosphate Glc1Man9GlcNAc2 alpha-1,3-glucosyltransferase [Hypsibius exemplaris]
MLVYRGRYMNGEFRSSAQQHRVLSEVLGLIEGGSHHRAAQFPDPSVEADHNDRDDDGPIVNKFAMPVGETVALFETYEGYINTQISEDELFYLRNHRDPSRGEDQQQLGGSRGRRGAAGARMMESSQRVLSFSDHYFPADPSNDDYDGAPVSKLSDQIFLGKLNPEDTLNTAILENDPAELRVRDLRLPDLVVPVRRTSPGATARLAGCAFSHASERTGFRASASTDFGAAEKGFSPEPFLDKIRSLIPQSVLHPRPSTLRDQSTGHAAKRLVTVAGEVAGDEGQVQSQCKRGGFEFGGNSSVNDCLSVHSSRNYFLSPPRQHSNPVMEASGFPPWTLGGPAGDMAFNRKGSSPAAIEARLRLMRKLQAAELSGVPVPLEDGDFRPDQQPVVRKTRTTSPFGVLLVTVTCFKFMLFGCYHSTDFEVHRNWLAITSSLPFRKWYYEATSEWTLDYPPLFAWMEWCLSLFARFFDRAMLDLDNLNYASPRTVFFQRLSVVALDAVYIYAVREGYRILTQRSISAKIRTLYTPSFIFAGLMLWNVGLLMVDHIHFQYNGFLLGLVQLAVMRILERRYFAAAFWFSLAVNMKHIFLYMAPAFGIFLLRQCCWPEMSLRGFNLRNFLVLGGIFGAITTVSLGPFAVLGQLPQVMSRLFPFQRGLTHAYWAPNVWALYNGVDKILTIVGPKLGLTDRNASVGALTGGLVGGQEHSVLPSISPGFTMALTVIGMLPALWYLWTAKTGEKFIRGLTTCTLASFLFGWHVHEKAILLAVVPFTWVAISNARDARLYLLLIISGYYGMHPLLFTAPEVPLKFMLIILYCYTAFRMFKDRFAAHGCLQRLTLPLLDWRESLYVLGFFVLELYNCLVHDCVLHLGGRLPFLPLMLTSMYSAVGVFYVYIQLILSFFHGLDR